MKKNKKITLKRYAYGTPIQNELTLPDFSYLKDKAYADAKYRAMTDPLTMGLGTLGQVGMIAGQMGVDKSAAGLGKVPGTNILEGLDSDAARQAQEYQKWGKTVMPALQGISAIGNTNMFAFGGTVPAEIEGGEVGQMPNGSMFQADGASHEQGGMPVALPPGTEMYSKRIKIDGVSMADRKKKREKRSITLEELVEKYHADAIIKGTQKRQEEVNAAEEAFDEQLQMSIASMLEGQGQGQGQMSPGQGQMPMPMEEQAQMGMQGGIPPEILQQMQGQGQGQMQDFAYGGRITPPNNTGVKYNYLNRQMIPQNNILDKRYYANYENPPSINETLYRPNMDIPEEPTFDMSSLRSMMTNNDEGINSNNRMGNRLGYNTRNTNPNLNALPVTKPNYNLASYAVPPMKLNNQYDYINKRLIQPNNTGVEYDYLNRQMIPQDNILGKGYYANYENPPSINETLYGSNVEIPDDTTGELHKPYSGGITVGDSIGFAGDLASTFGPMLNTLRNRAGDTPNINYFDKFGQRGLQNIDRTKDYIASMEANKMRDLELSKNAAMRRLRNTSRGVNELRALDLETDINANKSRRDIRDAFGGQMMGILGKEAEMQNQQDQLRMQGRMSQDMSDRMDRDNYYTNMAQNIATLGQGMQQMGQRFNTNKSRTDDLDMVRLLKKAGFDASQIGMALGKTNTEISTIKTKVQDILGNPNLDDAQKQEQIVDLLGKSKGNKLNVSNKAKKK